MATKYLDYAGLSKVVAYLKNYISVGDGLESIPTSTGKKFNVKYDDKTIVLNSTGELSTKVNPDNLASKIILTNDSEYSIIAKLFNSNDSEISESSVNLPLLQLVVSGYYTEDSEGHWIVLVLRNGNHLKIPVDAMVDGFVTINTNQDNIRGDKNFKGKLQSKGHEVLTKVDIDNDTIKLNSEGKLYADIEEQILEANKPIIIDSENKINLLYDDLSIKVGADGKLYSTGKLTSEGIKTIISQITEKSETIITSSEGSIEIAPEKVVEKITEKSETLIQNSEGALEVKIDNKTIVLNSEGELSTIAQKLSAQRPIFIDSENIINLAFDSESLLINSAGELAILSDMVYFNDAIELDGDLINVLYDDNTIKLDSENRLYVTGKLNSEGVQEVVTQITEKSETLLKSSEGTVEIRTEKVVEKITEKSETLVQNSEGVLEVKIDNKSIVLNSEGELSTVAQKLNAKKPVYIDSENNITLLFDNSSIVLNSEGELSTVAQKLNAKKPVVIDSENNITLSYAGSLFVDSENKLAVSIDNYTIAYNESEGYLEIPTEDIVIGDGLEFTSEGILNVCVDEKTIKIDSEGHLYSVTNLDSEGIQKLKGQLVKGSNTIEVTSEGVLEVISHEMYIGEGLELSSEGILSVLADEKTIVFDSESQLAANIDNRTIVYNETSGYMEVPTEDIELGDGLELDSEGILNVLVDNTSIKINSEGYLYATTSLDSEGIEKLKGQLVKGSTTIEVTSEGVLEVISHEMYIGEGLDLSSEGILSVLVDDKTIKINDEGELYSTASFDSEGIKVLKEELVKDSKTLTLDSEGALEVGYDDETVVLNTSGELSLPIDNNKVFINSEGYLDTAPTIISESELSSIIAKIMSGI